MGRGQLNGRRVQAVLVAQARRSRFSAGDSVKYRSPVAEMTGLVQPGGARSKASASVGWLARLGRRCRALAGLSRSSHSWHSGSGYRSPGVVGHHEQHSDAPKSLDIGAPPVHSIVVASRHEGRRYCRRIRRQGSPNRRRPRPKTRWSRRRSSRRRCRHHRGSDDPGHPSPGRRNLVHRRPRPRRSPGR